MPVTFAVPTAEDMHVLGARLGSACEGGDVIILSGDLGAGKTTIAQGIGRGLGIDERVTSPTFVIARVHPNPGDRPDLARPQRRHRRPGAGADEPCASRRHARHRGARPDF